MRETHESFRAFRALWRVSWFKCGLQVFHDLLGQHVGIGQVFGVLQAFVFWPADGDRIRAQGRVIVSRYPDGPTMVLGMPFLFIT